MGLGTFLVALVPGYAAIGIAGGLILSILRFVQGVGVGGEWGGSVLLAMEWGRHGRRGFNASWPQFGVPAGLLLANLSILFLQPYFRAELQHVGLAHPVHPQPGAGGRGPVDPPWNPRNANIPAAGRRTASRAPTGARSHQTPSQGNHSVRAGAHVRAS